MIPNGPGITARVLCYRYHGHDAVLDVQPEPATGGPPIVVRVSGGSPHPAGSAVCLRVRGRCSRGRRISPKMFAMACRN